MRTTPKKAEMWRVLFEWSDPEMADADGKAAELWYATKKEAKEAFAFVRDQEMSDTEDGDGYYVAAMELQRVLICYGNNKRNLVKLLNRLSFVSHKEPILHWAKYTPRRKPQET